MEMSPEYGEAGTNPAIADIFRRARETKAVLMRENFEAVLLDTDGALRPRRMYNVYSDKY
jgi:hypothetical protein